MMKAKNQVLLGLHALILNSLACRPVLTIGWQEILIVFLLIVVLMGPVIFNLYRRWDAFMNRRDHPGKDQ